MDFTFAINKIVKKKEKKILSINKKDQNTKKIIMKNLNVKK